MYFIRLSWRGRLSDETADEICVSLIASMALNTILALSICKHNRRGYFRCEVDDITREADRKGAETGGKGFNGNVLRTRTRLGSLEMKEEAVSN